jgi:hypothetical protein
MDRNADKAQEGYEKPRVADYGDLVELTATNSQNLLSDATRLGQPPPNQGFSI